MKINIMIPVMVVLLLSACNSTTRDSAKSMTEEKVMDKSEVSVSKANIFGSYWKLVTLNNKAVTDSANPHDQPHFMLEMKDNRVTGNGGCNGFFGSYSIASDSKIKFDKLASTRRACANTVVNEHEFMEVFRQADSFAINGDVLELFTSNRDLLAVFKALANTSK